MAGRIWLDPPGFVYVSLGAGGLQQQLPPPGSAGLPRARRAGSLGTAIVRLHKHPSVCLAPPPPLPPSPDPTGVAGRGAGRGPGCPGLRASRPSRAPGPFAPRSCFARVPAPPPGVSSSSIKRACTEPSVGCSVASFCVIGLLSASVGRPLLGFLPYLVPGSSKGQSLARSILSPVPCPPARSPLSHSLAP